MMSTALTRCRPSQARPEGDDRGWTRISTDRCCLRPTWSYRPLHVSCADHAADRSAPAGTHRQLLPQKAVGLTSGRFAAGLTSLTMSPVGCLTYRAPMPSSALPLHRLHRLPSLLSLIRLQHCNVVHTDASALSRLTPNCAMCCKTGMLLVFRPATMRFEFFGMCSCSCAAASRCPLLRFDRFMFLLPQSIYQLSAATTASLTSRAGLAPLQASSRPLCRGRCQPRTKVSPADNTLTKNIENTHTLSVNVWQSHTTRQRFCHAAAVTRAVLRSFNEPVDDRYV